MFRPQKQIVVVAVAITLAAAVSSLVFIYKLIGAQGWERHTYEVRTATDGLRVALLEAVAGHRAFIIIPGDKRYRDRFDAGAAAVAKPLAQLRMLTTDNPAQSKRVLEAATLVESKMAQLENSVATAAAGRASEAIAELGAEGGTNIVQIRNLLKEIVTEEDLIMSERSAVLDRWKTLITGSILLSLLGAGLIATTVSSAFRSHIEELTEANAVLESRVAERTAALKTEADHTRMLNQRQEIALKAGNFGTWDLNLKTKRAECSLRHDQIFGYSELQEDWRLETCINHVVEEDRAKVQTIIDNALSAGGNWDYEARIRCGPDKQIRWIEAHGSPRFSASGELVGFVGVVADITERKQAEGQLRVVTKELDHRSKNLMAIVASVSTQTARHSATIAEFMKTFSDRLQGLSHSQDALVGRYDSGADLRALVDAHLKAFVRDERIDLSGPALKLTPNATHNIGLALHELATNAAKYGALSVDGGAVAIDWRVGDGNVNLSWRERGGPPVTKPTRAGFGSAVIQKIVAQTMNGVVDVDYAPTGFTWSLSFPLAHGVIAVA